MKVLVVDDESGIRKLVSQMLAILGYEAVTAENGLEAVCLFAANRPHIDIVITDMQMPVMDGYETVRQLRKIHPGVRIVAMSAYFASTCPPGVAFLEKPFSLADLRDSLAAAALKKAS